MKYRRKPTVVEAMQLNGENRLEVLSWMNDEGKVVKRPFDIKNIMVNTPNGPTLLVPGNYIIKRGSQFELMDRELFEAQYERSPS